MLDDHHPLRGHDLSRDQRAFQRAQARDQRGVESQPGFERVEWVRPQPVVLALARQALIEPPKIRKGKSGVRPASDRWRLSSSSMDKTKAPGLFLATSHTVRVASPPPHSRKRAAHGAN